MERQYFIIMLCYISMIVFMTINGGQADQQTHHRQRRYLSFRNSTRFFMRLNFKANMVPWTQIFAQAIGFRVNWDEPPETEYPFQRLRVVRSMMYSHLQSLLDRNGLSGFHCIRRAICEMRMIAEPKGIYHKILKMIFRKSAATENWHNITTDECQLSINTCPLDILDVSLFTDL